MEFYHLKLNLFFLVVALVTSKIAHASDPNILTDFVIPPNNKVIDWSFFTYTRMCGIFDSDVPATFKVTKASMAEFPALNGQSVSTAVLQFPAGATNPPHTHPRSAELSFVVEGSLEVGFIDTTNKHYNQTLRLGDMFIFPKGLVHYQYNANSTEPAIAISAFGSASAGTVSVPSTVFASGIDDAILTKAFKTDVRTIERIKAGLVSKA